MLSKIAPPSTVLLIRLSSLGDVILTSAVFESLAKKGDQIDLLTSVEYAGLFADHPNIRKVYSFDRKSGLSGWLKLWSKLAQTPYDRVIDLHQNLRTFTAWVYWMFKGPKDSHWSTYQKGRILRALYYVFKQVLPAGLRPTQVREAYQWVATREKRSNFTSLEHLPKNGNLPARLRTLKKYFIWAPGSLWTGKKLAPAQLEAFFRFIEREANAVGESEKSPFHEFEWVIVGSKGEATEWREFVQNSGLARTNLKFHEEFGSLEWSVLAQLLKGSKGVIANDSGLLHFSEALGVNVFAFYGPTRPELGFAPQRSESIAQVTQLWCSPCSKDGSLCFRVGKNRYACMNQGQSAHRVWPSLREWLKKQAKSTDSGQDSEQRL